MFEHYYAVIMAGGSGSRLWPLSRKDRPKQSLAIGGEKTLFQRAVNRLGGLFPFDRILIVTVAEQVDLLRKECPEIPLENYVIEPLPRGTASVVGLAAIAISETDPQATMAILTADHLIENEEHLRQLLKAGHDAAQENSLVTLGITPTYPATGYGYIQKGKHVGRFQDLDVFNVARFKEKPDQAVAEKLVADGKHVWNSGMFVWRVDSVMAEFERQMPSLFEKLVRIKNVWSGDEKENVLDSTWPTIEPETIDYGIMEHARQVVVIPSVDLGWFDVGSWESLFDVLKRDSSGNIVMSGESVSIDTQGTLICEDSPERLVVTVGVEGLIIIDSGNALLVCDRKHAQRVREVVNYLKQNDLNEYL
jgi:mannose-1-phosphate guanylyltransferase